MSNTRIRKESDFIVPVYVNQRIVFDLLAMIQDGLSQVTKVTTTEGEKDVENRSVTAAFGLAQALSGLLKVDLTASRASSQEASEVHSRSEDRVHTPSSLLFKLRQMLRDEGQLLSVSSESEPEPGQIMEFRTTLRRNPLVQSLDTMSEMIDLWHSFSPSARVNAKKGSSATPHGVIKSQICQLRSGLSAGATVDIVSDRLFDKYTAVITLEEQFLGDPSMANLVEGEFCVLGKVIRVISSSDKSISLFRKTVFSALSKETLESVFAPLNMDAGEGGFGLPRIEWEIQGPAFQILPIGIYT